jgi:c(7)-type cytochrome triheme protein
MFIDRRVKPEPAPHRGAMCGSLAEAGSEPHSAPTERRPSFGCDIYKHFVAFVPMGLVVLVFCVLFLAFVRDSNVSASSTSALEPTPHLNNVSAELQDQNIDFSKFYHNNANHARLPCLLCHRREGTAAKPTGPGAGGHLPCAGCHAKEFANSSSPVCTICHTNTQSGALKAFPALKSFNVKFDHALHVRMGGAGCATCHRPSRAGVAMIIPTGLNAHVTCFQCHTSRAKSGDRDISSCGVCHQPGRFVRTREAAPAFRLGFSHAKHDRSEGLNCNDCHRIRAGLAQRLQVTAPQALNHHASPNAVSCMSCHNGKRAFGGDDFSVCKRCHTGTTWHF